ncbi:MAG: PIN/TRAM domain-containing protein [Clostridiales bacterium]|nr:PIN/TRAM domain-containing protein [Clostridiales bacterium]
MLKKFIYGFITLLSALIGFLIIFNLAKPILTEKWPDFYLPALILLPVIFAVIGLLIAPRLTRTVEKITESFLSYLFKTPSADIISGVIGLIAGLIIASLLGTALGRIDVIGPYLSIIVIVFLGYAGLMVGLKRREELTNYIISFFRREKPDKDKHEKKEAAAKASPKILDTSVIIDGRIADIYKTGFVEGELVIPGFVLEELRHIADSSDQLKRNRGRRGLDILNKLRNDFGQNVKIEEKNYPEIADVDSKLLRLALDLHGAVLTNDFNLNKVARLQGVVVLNINELSNAVKPVLLPGEELVIQVVKEGKEAGQGVGYLDDGTMVVVENSRRHMNRSICVVVTSVLQTLAGRMIFARPKLGKNGEVEEMPEECENGSDAP